MEKPLLEQVIDNTKIAIHAYSENTSRIVKGLPRLVANMPEGTDRARLAKAIADEVNRLKPDVTFESISQCATNCAALGLYPGPMLGHAHFIPFNNRKSNVASAQLVIGYRGLLHLAFACGYLAGATCEVVLRSEECKRWNSSKGAQLHHVMPLDREIGSIYKKGGPQKPNDIIAAYCQYETTTGFRSVVSVSAQKLSKIKDSKTKYDRDSPWLENEDEMAMKSAVRRAAKMWQWMKGANTDELKTSSLARLAAAIYLEEQADRGYRQATLASSIAPAVDSTPTIDLDALTVPATQQAGADIPF